jgi:hypothetical protein
MLPEAAETLKERRGLSPVSPPVPPQFPPVSPQFPFRKDAGCPQFPPVSLVAGAEKWGQPALSTRRGVERFRGAVVAPWDRVGSPHFSRVRQFRDIFCET